MIRHFLFLSLFALLLFAENNTTADHRIDVIVTVAGMQETARSIEQTSRQIAELTRHLSDKASFTPEDHRLIAALTEALGRNADAITKMADILPKELDQLQSSANNVLDHAAINVKQVVAASRTDLIDPTLERIQTQVLIFVIGLGIVLFGVVWFALWQLRSIVSTGSETIANITKTMHSVEKVVEKVNRSEEGWSSY